MCIFFQRLMGKSKRTYSEINLKSFGYAYHWAIETDNCISAVQVYVMIILGWTGILFPYHLTYLVYFSKVEIVIIQDVRVIISLVKRISSVEISLSSYPHSSLARFWKCSNEIISAVNICSNRIHLLYELSNRYHFQLRDQIYFNE